MHLAHLARWIKKLGILRALSRDTSELDQVVPNKPFYSGKLRHIRCFMLHADCEVAELGLGEVGIFNIGHDYDYVDSLTFTKVESFGKVVRVKQHAAGKSKLLRKFGIAVSGQINK